MTDIQRDNLIDSCKKLNFWNAVKTEVSAKLQNFIISRTQICTVTTLA